ncbi:MAG TPA: amidase [Mycobacteriales bacterium]|nr:amidase [Mycobacteriales bacterium]
MEDRLRPDDPDTVCDRIERDDPPIRAFVPEPGRRERLRSATAAAGPLHSVAVGIKDIIRVDGLPTRGGSALDPEILAGPQASVVTRLLDAGAIVAGKTVTAEFAVTAPNETRNPHDLEHTPGGSSSGSAAAVAAGLVPLAIGTQTIGSMIRPAAFCGVVGFKPTYGRIPIDGVIANAPSFDTLGIFAAGVGGVETAAGVVCEGWRPVETPAAPVLGVPDGPYLQHAEPEALEAFEAQLKTLAGGGITVRRIPVMADFVDIAAVSKIINRYEVARSHADWFPKYGDLYRPETVMTIREGQQIADTDYHQALSARAEFRTRIQDAMDGIDLWVAPSAPGPAPRGLETTGNPIMCMPWSHAGMPAVNIPAGRAGNGLPLGIQLVGRQGADERVLQWAKPVEALLPLN